MLGATYEQVHMPALLARFHKHVSSSQIERLVSFLNSKQSLPPWLKTVRHFSFTGDFSGNFKDPVGESDDFFQQSDLTFNDNGINRSQEGCNIQQCSSEQILSRPWRDLMKWTRQINLPKLILDFRAEIWQKTSMDVNQLGDGFLDKFKLGFDNKTVNASEVAASNQSEEAKRSDASQPALESVPQDADEIFKKMKETGLIPNAVAMLDGLCKDGNVQEALKLFGLMREKGTIPEIVIYTAVVEGYTKAHKADDAKRIFRKMQSSGISPNAFSYTVLIQGLYKCSRLQDAFEFCVEMLEAGHSPNVTTFVGLVDAFCKENGVEEAKGAIRTLIEKGLLLMRKLSGNFWTRMLHFHPLFGRPSSGRKPHRDHFKYLNKTM
ncbi:Tetratricopeptide-like helical domain superfamily [Sesbania bispinosa]|nr:Tetratricopeptide-like helical domain superfamily [Sesbania bispinosa]